jgi:hypothetical protein
MPRVIPAAPAQGHGAGVPGMPVFPVRSLPTPWDLVEPSLKQVPDQLSDLPRHCRSLASPRSPARPRSGGWRRQPRSGQSCSWFSTGRGGVAATDFTDATDGTRMFQTGPVRGPRDRLKIVSHPRVLPGRHSGPGRGHSCPPVHRWVYAKAGGQECPRSDTLLPVHDAVAAGATPRAVKWQGSWAFRPSPCRRSGVRSRRADDGFPRASLRRESRTGAAEPAAIAPAVKPAPSSSARVPRRSDSVRSERCPERQPQPALPQGGARTHPAEELNPGCV